MSDESPLKNFSVLSEPDEEGDEDSSESSRGDPERKLLRIDEAGNARYVTSRFNLALLRVAKALPVAIISIAPPLSFPSEDAMSRDDRVNQGEWIRTGLDFYWKLAESLKTAKFQARYIAQTFSDGAQRCFYFSTDEPTSLRNLSSELLAPYGFTHSFDDSDLSRVAPDMLPVELISELGLSQAGTDRMRVIGFKFTGADESLVKLRSMLEDRGFRLFDHTEHIGPMRMTKRVSVDQFEFREVLREIVPLSRGLRCSYWGEETLGGHRQFLLDSPIPAAYFPATSITSNARPNMFGRIFGRKST
jgi:hypothetical protein